MRACGDCGHCEGCALAEYSGLVTEVADLRRETRRLQALVERLKDALHEALTVIEKIADVVGAE